MPSEKDGDINTHVNVVWPCVRVEVLNHWRLLCVPEVISALSEKVFV